jgi:hypothetical protein
MSSIATSDSTIQALDEGIEEQTTPRLLLVLRVAVKAFLGLLLILAVVQYTINKTF